MSKKRTPHTSTWPGKRVRIKLSDGQSLEGRFVARTGQYVVIDVDGVEHRIKAGKVAKFIVIKHSEDSNTQPKDSP